MVLFLIAETMFFAAFVGAYIVVRLASETWRPDVLEDMVSALVIGNSVVLFVSAFTMALAQRSTHRGDPRGLNFWLFASLVLGVLFVGGQVFEFKRLLEVVPFGGNIFGSVFYSLSGFHAIHVTGGVVLLVYVLVNALRGKYNAYQATGVHMGAAYWYFVVVAWIFLFYGLYIW
tara:strand:- start:239 stop:760 length:522 start_codon:yes stop_codon:yes gene_type:complete